VLVARTEGGLEEVKQEIAKVDARIKVKVAPIDVTSQEAVKKLVEEVESEEVRLDVLINVSFGFSSFIYPGGGVLSRCTARVVLLTLHG
jgi:short-subunit dehydrogenase